MIDVVLGFAIAWLIVRTTLPGRQVLDALSMLPLAVPGLVMAFGFVALSLRWPFNTPKLEPFFDILGGEPNPIPPAGDCVCGPATALCGAFCGGRIAANWW